MLQGHAQKPRKKKKGRKRNKKSQSSLIKIKQHAPPENDRVTYLLERSCSFSFSLLFFY
jgi:hypothetical protein